MKSYSFKKKTDSGELHIFEGDFKPEGETPRCSAARKSICKKVDNDDSTVWVRQNCLTAQKAREVGAKFGRKLCGTCISHLYATPAR